MIQRLLSFLVIIGFAIVVIGYGGYQYMLQGALNIQASGDVIEIAKGESTNKVLHRLHESGMLSDLELWVAKFYLKEQYFQGNNLAGRIRAGEFELESGMTIPDLFALMSSNKQIQYRLTLVEGSTFKQVRDVLESTPKLKVTLKDQSEQDIMAAIPIDELFTSFHPEGLFFPDTYTFHKGDTDLSILQRAHKRLVNVTQDEWQNRMKNLPLKTPYDALILASIVEKETGVASEREQIAGVFIRRLKKGMRLQTDPTVIYGLGERYKGNITRKHLRELTPYNTYRINGLPPTPIALAGREAIHAALHPADGKELYFVAKGDGSHQFSATIEQHNKAVREYQLKRRSDYRSSPTSTN